LPPGACGVCAAAVSVLPLIYISYGGGVSVYDRLRLCAAGEDQPTCPFGFTAENPHGHPSRAGLVANISAKSEKVTMLYEEYIHLESATNS